MKSKLLLIAFLVHCTALLAQSTDDAKLLAKLEKRRAERKTNPKLAGKSSFQERLQKLAEQQQEILRQQQAEQKRKGKL